MRKYIYIILGCLLVASLCLADSTNQIHIRYIPADELTDTVIESNVLVSVEGDRNNLRIGDGVTTGGVRIMRTDALTSMPYTVGHDLSMETYDLWLDDEYVLAADDNGSAHLWRGSTNIWTVIASTSSVAVVSSETDGTNVLISLSAVSLLSEPDIYYSGEIAPPSWQPVTNAVYVWPPTGSVWTISCPIPEEATNGYFVVRYSDASIGITFGVPVHASEFWLGAQAITNISTNAAASGAGELMTASAIAMAIESGDFSGSWTNLSDVPSDLADGDNTNDAIASVSDVTSAVVAAWADLDTDATDDFSGSWTNLSDVPSDLADGDNTNDAIATASDVTSAVLAAWADLDTDATDDFSGSMTAPLVINATSLVNTAVGVVIESTGEGVSIGRSGDTYTFNGVAIGGRAKSLAYGTAVGVLANGSEYGCALGRDANGYNNGMAIGYQTKAASYGVGLGRGANAYDSAVAIGYQANATGKGVAIGRDSIGSGTNVAIGLNANAAGLNRISIGQNVTNTVDNSARIRGDLYLDGATGVYLRPTFGSGAWDSMVFDRANTQIINTVNGVIWTNKP